MTVTGVTERFVACGLFDWVPDREWLEGLAPGNRNDSRVSKDPPPRRCRFTWEGLRLGLGLSLLGVVVTTISWVMSGSVAVVRDYE